MIYTGEHTQEIFFPLGGIGSGSISLCGNGLLGDWEIFNRPNKGSLNGYTHFAIKAKTSKGVITKVLNGDLLKSYSGQYGQEPFRCYGFGPNGMSMCGFPHFSGWTFKGEFPVAEITFSDDTFPGNVTMCAFNPFIPLDEDNSSLPGAFFEITIYNNSEESTEYQTALSLQNPFPVSRNTARVHEGFQMLSFQNTGVNPQELTYGDMTIATDCPDTLVQTYWYRGKWRDGIVTYWNNFNNEQDIEDRIYDTDRQNHMNADHGTLAAKTVIPPGESQSVRFIISWNVPNNYNYWNDEPDENGKYISWKNYYAVLFKDSAHTAAYALKNWEMLRDKTFTFRRILHESTLDPSVIDAISSTLSVLKTPTVLRLEDGSFYGWEGLQEKEGSCEGTCQHVWNYAYALCYLFPRLERSIRENEFQYTVLSDGKSIFRQKLPLEKNPGDFRACLDGQMGTIIKCYREWKISGDDGWLKKYWGQIKLLLDYARSEKNPDKWDINGDGVLEGRQHHTLDMELFGPSAWLQGMYLAALKAAAEMAAHLGDSEKAAEYTSLFKNGKNWTKEHLFNGKYFIQQIALSDKNITDEFAADDYWNSETGEIKYQIGEGSSIDQLLGQWHADLVSLGEIFDPLQTDIALDSMFEYNFKATMRNFTNPWRIFALNDEAGTIICDYPEGAYKPRIPVPYCEEVMTGFEYTFAALLIYHGKIEKGLSVVKAIRDRYDGKKRNPYNELECGSNYARAMAAFSLLPAFSGFEYHLAKGHIGFNPIINRDHFKCLWSLGTGWGEFTLNPSEAIVTIENGSLSLCSFALRCAGIRAVEIDGTPVSFTYIEDTVHFEKQRITHSLRILL